MSPSSMAILSVPLDILSRADLRNVVENVINRQKPQYFLTVSAPLLACSQRDESLRNILQEARLVLGRGRRMHWASRLLGAPSTEAVSGDDLASHLIQQAADNGWRLYFLGDAPDVMTNLPSRLLGLFPNLQVAGHTTSTNPFQETNAIISRVRAASPDLLLVSLDPIRQEQWIASNFMALGVPATVGIGHTAHDIALYPRPASRHSIPRRIIDTLCFHAAVLRQWWKLRLGRSKSGSPGVSSPVKFETTWQCVKLPARLDIQAVRDDVLLMEQILADGRHCLLEMSGVEFIDSTGVGLLIRLKKKIRNTGRLLILLAPGKNILQALAMMQLHRFFLTAPDIESAHRMLEEHAATARTE